MPSNSNFITTLLFQHKFQIAAAPSPKGAHAAPTVRVPSDNAMASFFLLSTVLLLLFLLPLSSAITEAEALLTFKSSISNNTALSSWDIKNLPCKGNSANWVGVLCIQDSVWGLQLENMGFTGILNVSSLANLPNLRTISFMNNRFDGPMPEIKKIPALKSVFLSRNQLSGEVPADAFTGMVWLKKLYLSQNQFSGAIPASLVSLPKLMEARLDENHFEGLIPAVKTRNLVAFNVSDNALLGPIPADLSKMPTTMFQGNKGLCGQPLGPCNSPTAPLPSSNNSSIVGRVRNASKHIARSILIILILSVVALVAILAFMFALRRKSQPSNSIESPQSNLEKKSGIKEDQSSHGGSSHHSSAGRKGEVPKLLFVRDDREKFELPDLLKASAEILGSGCFGASYKAAPTTGSAMVVKRFKKMNNVGREEFHEHMRRIGRLNHPNLLPLVAYYYRKEEKLLVTDFVHNGSLAVHLHGHQSLGQPSLDWPTRLKIVKGVAAGLAYLYKELPSLIAPHGHLKSSNVLLNESYEPLLSDYGLIPVINQESAQELMVAYKSPEYFQNGRVTKKTDVWGLGILILEILTGQFPTNFLKEGQGDEEDLAMSVSSMVEEGRIEEVFDKEMEMEKNSIGEMVKLLKIGLNCCENVENRLELKEVVEKIEELKEKDDHDDDHSLIISDGEKKLSRGLSDDSTMS